MSRRSLALHAILVLAGCPGSGDDDPAMCAEPDGVYLFEFEVVSGDCGAIDSNLVRRDPKDRNTLDPGCETIHEEISDDGCTKELELLCEETQDDGSVLAVSEVSTITKAPDASSAEGIVEFVITRDGDKVCAGVYGVTITQQ